MPERSGQESDVGRYYDRELFDAEVARLDELFPIELAMTRRFIERYVPEGATVVECGVGGGQYSELLARRGCRLHLVDVSQRLLERVAARVKAASAHHASATNLPLETRSCDAALLLGPLYHLITLVERRQAVREAARVLKAGGVLLAAGINRLTYLRDLFRESPEKALARREIHARYLHEGVLHPQIAPPIGLAHLTTRAEFRALFDKEFEEVRLAAVESFAGPWQAKFKELAPDVQAEWLDLIEQTATWPETFGITDHYLFVGRRITG